MKLIKVKANKRFNDGEATLNREKGETFIVSDERFDFINKTDSTLITFVKEIEEEKEVEESKNKDEKGKEKSKAKSKPKKDDA